MLSKPTNQNELLGAKVKKIAKDKKKNENSDNVHLNGTKIIAIAHSSNNNTFAHGLSSVIYDCAHDLNLIYQSKI